MKRNKCIILLVFILTSRRRDILKGKNDTHMHQLLCNECQNIIVCVHVIYLSSVEKILVFGKFSVSYMDTKRKVSDTFVNTYCQNLLGIYHFFVSTPKMNYTSNNNRFLNRYFEIEKCILSCFDHKRKCMEDLIQNRFIWEWNLMVW